MKIRLFVLLLVAVGCSSPAVPGGTGGAHTSASSVSVSSSSASSSSSSSAASASSSSASSSTGCTTSNPPGFSDVLTGTLTSQFCVPASSNFFWPYTPSRSFSIEQMSGPTFTGMNGCGLMLLSGIASGPGNPATSTVKSFTEDLASSPQVFGALGGPAAVAAGVTYWFEIGCASLAPGESVCVNKYAGPKVNTYDSNGSMAQPPYWGSPTLSDPVAMTVEGICE